jgi:hypothetical protein
MPALAQTASMGLVARDFGEQRGYHVVATG